MNHYDIRILNDLSKGIHKFQALRPEPVSPQTPYVKHPEITINDIPASHISQVMCNTLDALESQDQEIKELKDHIKVMKTIIQNM